MLPHAASRSFTSACALPLALPTSCVVPSTARAEPAPLSGARARGRNVHGRVAPARIHLLDQLRIPLLDHSPLHAQLRRELTTVDRELPAQQPDLLRHLVIREAAQLRVDFPPIELLHLRVPHEIAQL